MAINYTTLLGLAQPVTGTESNVWGDVVNDSITALLDSAIAGTATINLTSGNVTLTDVDGAADQARMAILVLTGTPGVTTNVVAPSRSKTYIVVNQSNASAVLKGSATSGVTIRAGQAATCVWNGSDFEIVASGDVDGPSSATDNAVVRYDGTTGKLVQNSGVTIDDSNNVSGVVQLNATTVDTTNIEVTSLKAKDGTAAGSIADATGVVTLNSSVLTTTDINGGTIDNVTIGGSTAAAGSFTNLAYTGTLTGGTGVINIGSGQVYKDASGNVGIGNGTPVARLDVKADVNSLQARFGNVAGRGLEISTALVGGTNDAASVLNAKGSTGGTLIFQTESTNRMRITSTGEVLVNTDTIATGYNFRVFGKAVIGNATDITPDSNWSGQLTIQANGYSSGLSADASGLWVGTNSASRAIIFATDETERMRITGAGSVGIGTSSPTQILEVAKTGVSYIRARSTDSAFTGVDFGQAGSGEGRIIVRDSQPLSFYTAATERMRITSAGDVGIGTSSPGVNLDVQGSGTRTIRARSLDTSGSAVGVVAAEFAGGSTLSMRAGNGYTFLVSTGASDPLLFGTNSTERMRITSTGNLGIGSSGNATVRLDVSAATNNYAAAFYANTGSGVTTGLNSYGLSVGGNVSGGSAEVNLIYGSAGGGLAFNSFNGTTITERMRLDSSGNLGLGVTPAVNNGGSMLQVNAVTNLMGNSSTLFLNGNATYNSGWKYITNGYATQYQQDGGFHKWSTAPSGTAGNAISFTQAMTLDASGNLIVGSTVAGAAGISIANTQNLSFTEGTGSTFVNIFRHGGTGDGVFGSGVSYGSGSSGVYRSSTSSAWARTAVATGYGAIKFFTSAESTVAVGSSVTLNEAARIDTSGNLLVGTQSKLGGGLSGIDINSATYSAVTFGTGGTARGYVYANSVSSRIQTESIAGWSIAAISGGTGGVTLANGATSWAALSDERRKDIIEPIENAAEKVASLRAVIGKYKTDEEGTRRSFLIAQDVDAVLPEAVDKSDPDNWALRYTETIPLLVAAFNELKAEFDAYKAAHP